MKPDVLTRCWDIYSKEGNKDYTHVNPDNYRPILTNKQLPVFLQAMYLEAPMLWAATFIDIKQLQSNILSSLPNDPVTSPLLSSELLSDPHWTIKPEGFLLWGNRIFVPGADNLRLHVHQTFHDYPTAGHFGQN